MNQIVPPTPLELEVRQVLVAVTGKEPGMDDNLFEQGLLDSLQMVNLILVLEENFSMSLTDEEINFDHFQSPRRIARKIQLQRALAQAK